MKKSLILVCGLGLAAAAMNVKQVSAQQFPGTNSMLTSPTTLTLMRTLGYAPNDYCGFYFYLSTSYAGRFSPDLLRALLPMCAEWPTHEPPADDGSGDDGQSGGGTTGSGTAGGGTGSGSTGEGTGGTGGSGSTGGTGGSGSTGGTGGSGSTGETGGGTGSTGETGGGSGSEDPFGGGSMATPEPISLILLGTGLAAVGGVRSSRRRRRPDNED